MDITVITLSTQPATVQVQTPEQAKIEIISTGKVVASGVGPVCRLEVPKCILWSDATPKLYTCRVTVGDQTEEKKFGICQYSWQGNALQVNRRPAQLRPIFFDPACAISPKDLWRRVLILKDGYFNGLVCENAPQELKAACDYYGLYLLKTAPAASGDNACVVDGTPVDKLRCVAGDAIDTMGNLLPACAYATTRWEMELEVRFGVRPSDGSAPLTESWSWPGREGQKMDVEVYALAPAVELKLNGKSLGKKKTADCKAVYKVPYAPGKLEAAAFNGSGTKIAGGKLEAASGAEKLCLRPEIFGETAFVAVTIEGENGGAVCGEDRDLQVSVSGGELLYASGKTLQGRGLVAVCPAQGATLAVTAGKLSAEIQL